MQSFTQRQRIFLVHLLFWGVYASFFFYQISFARKVDELDWDRVIKDFLFHIVGIVAISYFNYLYLLPRFLAHKNFGRYLGAFVLSFALFIYFFIMGKQYLIDGLTRTEHWVYSQRYILSVIINSLVLAQFVGMLKFAENWFELEARKKEIENEKLSSELRFLKAQINPHFLFNTLNNLYYLAFTNSPNTTEVIDKLSQMMRYMIYDSNHPKVPLSKELEYMKHYISLERLRLNNQVPISFDITGNTEGIEIVPLILITFLENAFKHGVTNNSTDAWIKVHLSLKGQACLFSVENSKLPTQIAETAIVKSGIGLQNVERRLALSYPNQYKLSVKNEPNSYAVHLHLNLT